MPSRDDQQRKRFSQAEQQRRANAGTTRPQGRRGASRRATPSQGGGRISIPGWAWIVIGLIVGIIATKLLTGGSDKTDQPKGGEAAIVARSPSSTDSGDASGQQDGQAEDASSQDDDQQSDTKQSGDKPSAAEKRQQEDQAQEKMPSFQFYTLLPKSEVIAPNNPDGATTMSTPPPAPHHSSAGSDSNGNAATSAAGQSGNAGNQGGSNDGSEQQQSSSSQQLGGARYLLQAASYRNRSDADTMASNFKSLGLTTQVSQVQTGDGTTWYRVQAGPYTSSSDLDKAKRIMRSKGITPLTLRQR